MLRFKQFAGASSELEGAVNDWLAEFEPDIKQMSQTATSDGRVTLCFVFEESFRGQERRLTAEARRGMIEPAVPVGELLDEPLRVDPNQ
ncbi:MAG TPA: hypothetical protein VKX16_05430 [Chloroflexota bacterium]|nr:hypothetical protein [Chloroflexota bacterium]